MKIAGYKPNPVLFSDKHIALDGHKCDSFTEMLIDNWLFDKGITHEINVSYPEKHNLTVDFKVGDYWIEFFGLAGNMKKYNSSMNEKLRIARTHDLKLLKIYPSDMFPVCRLEILLEPVVMYYAKSLIYVD